MHLSSLYIDLKLTAHKLKTRALTRKSDARNEKLFKCSYYCNAFSQNACIYSYMVLNTIEKLFKCRDGDKVSSHKHNLNRHIMKFYTDGETIYSYADYGTLCTHTSYCNMIRQ